MLATRYERVKRGNTVYSVVAKIDVGHGTTISVLGDDTPFEVPSWCYEINEGDKIVVPIFRLNGCCSPEGNPKFRLLTSEDRSVVGLVWNSHPNVLLVLHDFDSGETWPGAADVRFLDGNLSIGRKLRDKLQAVYPQQILTLSSEN